jgi:hypothetical protein
VRVVFRHFLQVIIRLHLRVILHHHRHHRLLHRRVILREEVEALREDFIKRKIRTQYLLFILDQKLIIEKRSVLL